MTNWRPLRTSTRSSRATGVRRARRGGGFRTRFEEDCDGERVANDTIWKARQTYESSLFRSRTSSRTLPTSTSMTSGRTRTSPPVTPATDNKTPWWPNRMAAWSGRATVNSWRPNGWGGRTWRSSGRTWTGPTWWGSHHGQPGRAPGPPGPSSPGGDPPVCRSRPDPVTIPGFTDKEVAEILANARPQGGPDEETGGGREGEAAPRMEPCHPLPAGVRFHRAAGAGTRG